MSLKYNANADGSLSAVRREPPELIKLFLDRGVTTGTLPVSLRKPAPKSPPGNMCYSCPWIKISACQSLPYSLSQPTWLNAVTVIPSPAAVMTRALAAGNSRSHFPCFGES